MNRGIVSSMTDKYATNPASGRRIVPGAENREYLELNRMWLSDVLPPNSESMAISSAIRFIRGALPAVKFIQTFADERCGRLGVVYQACNFLYCGSHRTTFYRLDGDWYHEMLLTAHRKAGNRGAHLRANLHRAEAVKLRQFRYIKPLHKSARRKLALPVLPYPKPEARIP